VVKCVANSIDPLLYDSTAKRLNTSGYFCQLDATGSMCNTNSVVYNTTYKRLVVFTEGVTVGSYCSGGNLVSYDSTNKRLKYSSQASTPCGGV